MPLRTLGMVLLLERTTKLQPIESGSGHHCIHWMRWTRMKKILSWLRDLFHEK